MRNLKYAILGLVDRQPMTGYDIKKSFDDRALTNFWHAEHSQIYPELKKLIEEGLLEYEIVIQRGQKLESKLYTITPKGKEEFHHWLTDDVPIERTHKDIFRLRTFFSDAMSKEEYLTLLYSQLDQHSHKLNRLAKYLEEDFPEPPSFGTLKMDDYLVLTGAVRREQGYVAWLQSCIDLIEKS